MNLKPVTDDTFHQEIRENMDPTVVYFTGKWCQSCKTFGPVVETIASRMENDIRFFKADIEMNEKEADALNIRSLPSLVLFVDGMVRDVHVGTMQSNDLRLWIQENI